MREGGFFMKTKMFFSIVIMGILLFVASSVNAYDSYYRSKNRCYDNRGVYQGYFTESGFGFYFGYSNPSIKRSYYDRHGRYQGYSIESRSGYSRYYDRHGRYERDYRGPSSNRNGCSKYYHHRHDYKGKSHNHRK
jgi:hypothetical protein